MSNKRGPGRPGSSRIAITYLIRARMIEPLANGGKEITYVQIADRIAADYGVRVTPDAIQKTVYGKCNHSNLQRLIAKVLGLPLYKAFPLKPSAERPAPPDLRVLGGRIRKAREDKRLSIIDLAKKIGRTFSTIGHWENGRVTPPKAQLKKLAKILGVNLGWLLEGTSPATGTGKKEVSK